MTINDWVFETLSLSTPFDSAANQCLNVYAPNSNGAAQADNRKLARHDHPTNGSLADREHARHLLDGQQHAMDK